MVNLYKCKRCGHEWAGRLKRASKVCPACNSPYWNRTKWKGVADTSEDSEKELNNRFGYSKQISKSFRIEFMWLCQEVESLVNEWDLYVGLFGSVENTEVLDEMAPGCFRIIEESLRDDMTMTICRLSDPSTDNSGNKNISMDILSGECIMIEGIPELLQDFAKACAQIEKVRNKLVAHNDMKVKVNPQDNILLGVGRKEIDIIVGLAIIILQKVYEHFTNSSIGFMPAYIGKADDLVNWLRSARDEDRNLLPRIN
ncbi:hypothetical protein ACFLW1_02635 [Chloroflexota bacterium]